MKMHVVSVAVLAAVAFGSYAQAESDKPKLPPHPRLLLNQEGVARLKQRVAEQPWAVSWWKGLVHRADAGLKKPVELPPRGGNWWHWYVCPDDGTPLKLGRKLDTWQWEHRCPLCEKVFTGGDPSNPSRDFDGCQIRGVHFGYADAVRDCGLAWQVTGEPKYRDRAREILLAYADRYLTYPLHKNGGGSGIGGSRVGSQTLTEACWLILMAQGADFIWPDLSDTDRQQIANKLFQPAARDVILVHKIGIHNIQCWKNSAVGLVGLLLDDQELIDEAIDNPKRGYRVQMQEGVTPDGSWYEGAWGYHFYTIRGTWPLCEAARNCEIDLYGEQLRSMFDGPIRVMSPTGVLPAFNDSGPVSVAGQAPFYELAYARFNNPAYLPLLAGRKRGEMAVLCGVDELPDATEVPAARSANYTDAGFAILTRGEGREATWLCLDYGPHGGGHGHPDKLGFVLFARGEELAVDPGTARYGTPLQKSWFRTTLAHNTLVVDEKSQKKTTGSCPAFGSADGTDYLVAQAEPYDGVTFVRAVALLDENTLVFLDKIDGTKDGITLDLAYHQRGQWGELPAGKPWTPANKPGYEHLRDATIRQIDQPVHLPLPHKAAPEAAIVLAGNTPTQVITGTGIGRGLADRVPMVIFRRNTSAEPFAWAISLDGHIRDLQVTATDAGYDVTVGQPDNARRVLHWTLAPEATSLRVD